MIVTIVIYTMVVVNNDIITITNVITTINVIITIIGTNNSASSSSSLHLVIISVRLRADSSPRSLHPCCYYSKASLARRRA